MAYEISKTLDYKPVEVTTPLGVAETHLLSEQPVVATILRAGLPVHQGILNVFDRAENAFISAYRKHHKDGTFEIKVEYLSSPNLEDKVLILCDPMLATGGSACAAIRYLKEAGCRDIQMVCLVAAPEGVRRVHDEHPDVMVHAAALDRELDGNAYIRPGLGDAGDRVFGTIEV